MNDDGAAMRLGTHGGRWAALAAVATLIAGLVVGIATPAQADPAVTSIRVRSVLAVAAPAGVIATGRDVLVKGVASANLKGRSLGVQVRINGVWRPSTERGTVASNRTFTIELQASGVGPETFRVYFNGSSGLAKSSGTRSATVWLPYEVVDLPAVTTVGSSSSANAPHAVADVVLGGVTYPRLLAGVMTNSQSGTSTFDVGSSCGFFFASVGLADSSAAVSTGTFTVATNNAVQATQTEQRGSTGSLFTALPTGDVQLSLRNSDTVLLNPFRSQTVITTWRKAEVFCSAAP